MNNELVKWAMQEALKIQGTNTVAIAMALLRARALQASLDGNPFTAVQAAAAVEILERSDLGARAAFSGGAK